MSRAFPVPSQRPALTARAVLTVVDGLRPDAILERHEGFRRLALWGASTLEARSVMPSVTLPCHMSIFHAVPPTRHGVTSNVFTPMARPVPGLADVIAAAGAKAAAFYSWEPLRDVTRPGSLIHAEHVAYRGDPDVSDHRTFERALPFVTDDDVDFTFLYLGSIDEVGHDHGWMSDRYLRQVDLVDALLGRLLDALEEALHRDTYLLVLADHGGHDRSHGTDRPEDMTVPFFVAGPDVQAGVQLDGPVSLLDVAPTIAAALGLSAPSVWEGRDVAPRTPLARARAIDPDRDVSTIDLRGMDVADTHGEGRLTLVRAPDVTTLARDASTLATVVGTHVLAPLLTETEASTLGLAQWPRTATDAGLQVTAFPIDDMSVPTDLGAFTAFVSTLASAFRNGKTLTLHCRAGLGRSGLVAACLLVQLGAPALDAIACVRASRPGAIETPQQEAFVAAFADTDARTTRT